MHYRDDGREEYDNGGRNHVRLFPLGALKKIVIATKFCTISAQGRSTKGQSTMKAIVVMAITLPTLVSCFGSSQSPSNTGGRRRTGGGRISSFVSPPPQSFASFRLHAMSEDEERELQAVQEESRLRVLTDRRKTIRGILKAAESTKNYRINNGMVTETDPTTGKPIKSEGTSNALSLTAFVVAGGAVLLRFGGRAALVSALGLDFATENPQLKDGLDTVLGYGDSVGVGGELALFVLAWTAVKVFCFDAGGVVLALASGLLFGGVIEGAVVSSFGATVGSSVAFALAKLDTPVRKKALEVVEQYPSLRGIEKVVARDGLKAILTLRLAPVLPIPIGLYNYVYGVTNVPYWQFASGIFLGSLKPYLLDSYLGVFGKQIVDGEANGGGMEDILLLIALGASVLIGIFASQLANETWESINEEIEIEKKEKASALGKKTEPMREVMGMGLPQFIIGMQYAFIAADERVNDMIVDEYRAKVWNYTIEEVVVELSSNGDMIIDPAAQPGSPEVCQADTGFDFGASVCEGLVLSPALFGAYMRYSDPLYVDENIISRVSSTIDTEVLKEREIDLVVEDSTTFDHEIVNLIPPRRQQQMMNHAVIADELLSALSALRVRVQKDIDVLS